MRFFFVRIIVILIATTASVSSAKGSKFVRRRKSMDTSKMSAFLYEDLIPGVIGTFAFYGTLGVSTCFQKSLGITTGNRLLARMVGFPTVCAASILSDRSVRLTREVSRDPSALVDKKVLQVLSTSPSANECYVFGIFRLPQREVHVCMLGLGGFWLLGGRLWAIAPSSYAAPGSYARMPLPGTKNYIQGNSKAQLNKNYKLCGCHVCGSKVGTPIGDHNPPKSIGNLMKNPSYKFLPHCGTCSSRQGGIMGAAVERMDDGWRNWRKIWFLKAAGGGSNSYNHAFQIRLNHFTGGIISTSVGDAKGNISVPANVKKSISGITRYFKRRFAG